VKLPLFFSALCAAGVATLVAADKPLVETIAIGAPEVVKLDWNTRALTPCDLQGNGLTDLAVLNNDRAQIDLLYQLKPGTPPPPVPPSVSIDRWEPVVADAHFKKISLTTGITMFDLAIGDLNGTGRPDLAYTGDPQALTIRYQQKDGDWTEKKIDDAPEPSQQVSSLAIADLTGNGRNDLVMLGKKELAIFYQDEKGELGAPERYALSDEDCYGLEVCDVNGDGRPDIVYLSSTGTDTLRVRLQSASGQFGPEQSYPLKALRSTLQVLNAAGKNGPAQFAVIQDPTGQLVVFTLDSKTDSDPDKFPVPRPRIFTPRAESTSAESYAFGDFAGDGREDVAVSDPEGAQIFIYFRQPDGGFTVAKRFPSLSDGRSIAAGDWDGSGRASLFVASPKEEVVGVATITPEGRLTYPQPLPVTGKPFAVATGDLAGTGHDQLVVARSDKNGKYALEIWAGTKGGKPQLLKTIDLPDQKNDPRAVRVFDAKQDGRMDIAVFTPFEPMRLFVQGEKFSFTEATPENGFRTGLVDSLDSAALTVTDTVGDGKAEMLVSGSGYARALRLKPTGELEVMDQFNARDPSATIAGAFALPASGPGQKPVLVLYDSDDQLLEFLHADDHGVYQFAQAMPVGKIDLVGIETRRNPKTGQIDVFLLGKDRFWWLPIGQPDFSIHVVATHTTDLPDISYSDVEAGDLTGDGRLDLACIDPDKNLIEILSQDEAGVWQSRMHFKVFEKDEHYQGRHGSPEEPRETLIAPVTGNGKNDLILLVHDRVLVYPQE
jgi:hypothetical protein